MAAIILSICILLIALIALAITIEELFFDDNSSTYSKNSLQHS